ncbi:MAG: hypothetical protein HY072_03230, partial [Deltaproteobacteria bacterium]|nr:hypothetical protein [Deltaproteobacteria bacterium]
VLFWSSIIVSFSPIPYCFFTSALAVKCFAPFEFFLNGIGWGGFYLSFMTLLFRVVPDKKTTLAFSVFSCVIGMSSAVFTFLGGKFALLLMPYGGFPVLWGIGAGLRYLVVFSLFKKCLIKS